MSAQGASVEDTLKDFWATRPRRPRRGRKLAGVASGIGLRNGIDPIVIRVAFVVATFYGGAGILVYLLGWLLLPEQDDEAAPFESMINHRRSSTSSAFTVLLCIALIPAFWFFADKQFGGILGLLIVAGALFLLHRSRGHLNRPAPTVAPPFDEHIGYAPFGAPVTESFTGSSTAQSTARSTEPFGATAEPVSGAAAPAPPVPPAEPAPDRPPAWDPLGAAPFAWDLPEPSQPAPEPPQRRRKSRIGLFTLGAVLVAAGTLALVAPYVGGWVTPAHVVGVVLALIGFGLVGGAFAGGGRGLIGLAVPLSVIGLGLTVMSPDGYHGMGDITDEPATIGAVQPMYQRSSG
ncbi:MAG: PspC domain-containing protein, partial [Labedaea sp.]